MKTFKKIITAAFLCGLLAGLMSITMSITAAAAVDPYRVSRVCFTVTSDGIEPGVQADECGISKSDITITSITYYDGENDVTEEYDPLNPDKLTKMVSVDDMSVVSPSGTLKVGDEIKLGIYFDTHGAYWFKSGTKFSVSGATTASTSRKGDGEYYVTVKLKPVKGNFSEPQDLTWKSGSLGQATWSAPEANGTGYYNLQLLKNDHAILTVTNYHGTSVNFYPWMTVAAEYSFKVKTIGYTDTEKKYGKASEYAESDSQTVEKEKVSDGSGQTDLNGASYNGGSGSGTTPGQGVPSTQVGWVQNGSVWNYYFPDGTKKINGWELINNKWYLFNSAGTMLTGWQTVDGKTFYMAPDGHMRHGWVKTNEGTWYYLNSGNSQYTDGQLVKKAWIDSNGNRYYLTDTGAMAVGWYKIDGKTYYFNENENGPKGAMVRNTRVNSFWLGEDGAWVQGQ